MDAFYEVFKKNMSRTLFLRKLTKIDLIYVNKFDVTLSVPFNSVEKVSFSRIVMVVKFNTVEVMIMSRYRYCFWVSVTDRYRFWANVTQRYAT